LGHAGYIHDPLLVITQVSWHVQIELENLVGAKFYCQFALDIIYCLLISRDNALFSPTVSSTSSFYYGLPPQQCGQIQVGYKFLSSHTTHNRFMALDFVWDNPCEPVPEETFTHSHLSW